MRPGVGDRRIPEVMTRHSVAMETIRGRASAVAAGATGAQARRDGGVMEEAVAGVAGTSAVADSAEAASEEAAFAVRAAIACMEEDHNVDEK